eukprot:scaffold5286_cov224-Pinguiococcus_pyrenoidosus.AAC.3
MSGEASSAQCLQFACLEMLQYHGASVQELLRDLKGRGVAVNAFMRAAVVKIAEVLGTRGPVSERKRAGEIGRKARVSRNESGRTSRLLSCSAGKPEGRLDRATALFLRIRAAITTWA